jgi:asparagine synthase (glutamine-hydrolysing)
MCGIAGIVSFDGKPVLRQELHNMCSAIAHRGPDDAGYYLDAHAGIGMRRLSIIDVSAGHQPISNEDGSVWVVFNGEIYDFRELRRDLESRGHKFATNTDTEVIVHLYEEYGPQCVEYLRGMFAFAVWDVRMQELLLARDRLGIKPLYYAYTHRRLIFASELKSILELPEVGRELNWGSVSHLLTFLTTPPAESIIDGIHKLEPGHFLTFSPQSTPATSRYWEVEFEPDRSKPGQWFVDRTAELIAESVRLHMVSDVPVGAFLSGGIDSSAVVSAACKATTGRLQTFSIGFKEAAYNELDHARQVAAALGTDHRELILGPDSLDDFERLVWHLDEPFGDSSAIPTYMVSKLAASSVKVVLSGDGGDELFAGYDKYMVEGRERMRTPLPQPARAILKSAARRMPAGMRGRNFLRHRCLNGAARYLDASTLFRRDELGNLFQPAFSKLLAPFEPWREKTATLEAPGRHWLSRLQHCDIQNYLPLDILTKVDRMSMAHSLETRVPLLDHKLVEFAATIPPELNVEGGVTKSILKRAMRTALPPGIINRPKHGFAVPLDYWFRGKLGGYAHDLLLGNRTRQRGFFKPQAIAKLLQQHQRGKALDLHIWTLMSFELWARTFLDRNAATRSTAA